MSAPSGSDDVRRLIEEGRICPEEGGAAGRDREPRAGQDHIARLYGDEAPTIRTRGDRAVVLFPQDRDHRLAPWFFRRTADGWRLDGATPPSVIGYNHRNQWRFRTLDHPYMFAFEDFRFDDHGFAFPQAR